MIKRTITLLSLLPLVSGAQTLNLSLEQDNLQDEVLQVRTNDSEWKVLANYSSASLSLDEKLEKQVIQVKYVNDEEQAFVGMYTVNPLKEQTLHLGLNLDDQHHPSLQSNTSDRPVVDLSPSDGDFDSYALGASICTFEVFIVWGEVRCKLNMGDNGGVDYYAEIDGVGVGTLTGIVTVYDDSTPKELEALGSVTIDIGGGMGMGVAEFLYNDKKIVELIGAAPLGGYGRGDGSFRAW